MLLDKFFLLAESELELVTVLQLLHSHLQSNLGKAPLGFPGTWVAGQLPRNDGL